KGVIRIPRENISSTNTEELQLKLIDAGADDVRDEKEGLVILTDPKKLEEILMHITKEKFEVASSGIELIANTPLDINDKVRSKIEKLIEALEEHEDVNAVYTNANV
ncbi:YebC/PmpR family DNA-binding transcriptional regulator, partial [Patescibacteria group bacterium]